MGGTSATGGASECTPDAIRRCTGDQPQICTNGLWVDQGSPCSPAGPCNYSKGACDTCLATSKRCGTNSTGAATVETCSATGDAWNVTQTCTAPNFCDADKWKCVACMLTDVSCQAPAAGAELVSCRGDQAGYTRVSCGGYPCNTPTDGVPYCTNCDPSVHVPSCTTEGVLITCDTVTHLQAQKVCTHGCIQVSTASAGSCAP